MLNKRREWIQGTVLLCFASNMNKILLDLDDIQTKLENKCSKLNPVEVPKNSFYYFFLLKSLFLSFFFLNYKLCWLIWKINRKMNDSFYIELFMSCLYGKHFFRSIYEVLKLLVFHSIKLNHQPFSWLTIFSKWASKKVRVHLYSCCHHISYRDIR